MDTFTKKEIERLIHIVNNDKESWESTLEHNQDSDFWVRASTNAIAEEQELIKKLQTMLNDNFN